MTEEELLVFLKECKTASLEYMAKFKQIWDECEQQIRCVMPEAWKRKEEWQTKIYIPQQAKKEEVALSYLNKMVFGKRRNFDISGVEKDDREEADYLTTLMANLLSIGKFKLENDFILTEAIGLGTSFCKVLLNKEGDGMSFTWRSLYNCGLDPEAGHNFEKSRWWIDFYTKDISDIIQEARNPKSIYSGAKIQEFISEVEQENRDIVSKSGEGYTPTQEEMITVKSIDNTQEITMPAKYKKVNVDEYWVDVPNEKGVYEKKVITVLQERFILRQDDNAYGYIPVAKMVIKPRKYDAYGKGYVENTRGLQDLANSCVCLGFDSLKISAMDIIILNENMVKDPTSIKYKPLAIWKMKDVKGVTIQRQPMSAISDILRGLQIIDQIDQDASGVARHAQGSPSLSGEGTQAETLGEYQLKLQAIDQRFLDVGRFIENSYFLSILRIIFGIIINPVLFSQKKVDDIIGMKEVDKISTKLNEETGVNEPVVEGMQLIPKLELDSVRRKGKKLAKNFKAVGITQFVEKLEVLSKLKEALGMALSNPTLTVLTKIDELWKKLWQVSEIEDYEDLLRTKEEVKQALEGMQGAMQQPQGEQQGGQQTQ